jgi:hypothetical protein
MPKTPNKANKLTTFVARDINPDWVRLKQDMISWKRLNSAEEKFPPPQKFADLYPRFKKFETVLFSNKYRAAKKIVIENLSANDGSTGKILFSLLLHSEQTRTNNCKVLPPSKSEMAEKTAWVGEKKKEGLIPKKVIKPKKDTPSTKNFKVQLPFLSYPLVLTRRPKNRKTVSKSVYVHEEKLVVVLQLNSGGKVKEFKLSDCGQELNVKFSNHVLAFNPEGIHDALYADHTLISGQTQEEYFTRLQAMEKAECSSNQDIGLQEMTILLDKPASVENMIQRSYVFEVTKDNPVQTSFAYFEFDTLKPKVDESTNVNKGDNVRFHEMKDDHNDSGSDGDCDNNANDDDHSHHHSNQQPRSQGGGQGGNGGNGGDNTNHNNNNTHQSRTPHRQQSTTFQQQQQHQGQGQGQSNMDIDSQSDHDNFDVSTQQKFEVELQKCVSVAKDEYKKKIEGRVNNFRENAKKERIESIRITKKLVNEKIRKTLKSWR